MACLRFKTDHLVFINHADIIVYNIPEKNVIHLSNKRCLTPKTDLPQNQTESGSLKILSANFSPGGRYFAYSDDFKQLIVYRTGGKWERIGSCTVIKRCMSIVFTEAEDEILIADKSGDVYNFKIEDGTTSDVPSVDEEIHKIPLMGHLSTILDMAFTKHSKCLITCDRNEKIRIGHYPNLYNIQAFCLGHTQYVVKLLYLDARDVLLSSSGDGSIRCWNIESGAQLASHQIHSTIDKHGGETNGEVITSSLSYCAKNDIVAVSYRNSKEVHFLKLSMTEPVMFSSTQTIHLDTMPLDVTFGDDGHFWVLTKNVDNPLVVYSQNAENLTYEVDSGYELSGKFTALIQQSLKDNPSDKASNFNPVKKWDAPKDGVGEKKAGVEIKRKSDEDCLEGCAKKIK